MFDRKIEPIAQRVVRAKLMLEEAKEVLALAEEDFKMVVPEGAKYVTKDGETVTHAKSSRRKAPVVEALQRYLKGPKLRIWRAVRIDAIDMKKLNGFIDAGELDLDELIAQECITEVPVSSSIRVTFPAIKPTITTTRPSKRSAA